MDRQTIDILASRTGDKKTTWKDVLSYLQSLNEDQLQQEAMLLPPNPTPETTLLQPIIGMGTIAEMCHINEEIVSETRSGEDFAHHPEQVVLFFDYAPYDEHGNTFFTLTEDGFVGNKTGEIHEEIDQNTAIAAMQDYRDGKFQTIQEIIDEI
jgi:hypothetical protein